MCGIKIYQHNKKMALSLIKCIIIVSYLYVVLNCSKLLQMHDSEFVRKCESHLF